MKRFLSLIIVFFLLLFAGNAFAQQADATLELKPSTLSANVGDTIDVEVELKNPGLQKVISVRSWIEYDANALEGVSIIADGSPFGLTAPGEDAFDPENGRVKIGRSNITGGMTGAEATVVTIRFKVKTASPIVTSLDFYDYQVTELGHTSVNIIDQGFPVNILAEEPGGVQIQLNDGAPSDQGNSNTNTNTVPDGYNQNGIGGAGTANLARPSNLRVNTGSGYVDLRWEMSFEPELTGYNIYYGKTSGQYTRRRTVGRLNQYRLDGLNNDEVYYFAITAYDNINRESDYSDEVAVIVGQPLSSTAPFEELLNLALAQLPAQPQNGPITWWLFISAAGLAWVIVFRKRRI